MTQLARSTDGIPLHADVVGTGHRALVLVHGWSCDRRYWATQVDRFAEDHTVVAVDLAGHGESGSGRGSWTMPAFGADVVAVVDALGLDDVVLVGHSMGGDVIVEAALELGGRVSGLVWLDTYQTLGTPDSEAAVDAFVEPFRHDFVATTRDFVRGMFPPGSDPELVEWVVADMSSAPPDIALDALRHAIGNEGPVIAALPSLDVPIVAINPGYEPTDVEAMARHGVATVIVPGVGHFLMLEDPDRVNAALASVIEGFD